MLMGGGCGSFGVAATDGTLVCGVLSGDREAFAELYDRRARLIRAICFNSTGNLDTAADLTQEVFYRAYAKLRTLRDPQRFVPWLIAIAKQVCREWQRGRFRETRRMKPLSEVPPLSIDDELPDDRVSLLRDAVATLPERERLSVQAFYLSGLDADEARTVLGLSRATLYRVLAGARLRLKRTLRGQEVKS
jgi:RNA polymerase sigma-70 factor (ECF subfamily)